MKRIIALLCCLVLLCAAVPALAYKPDNRIFTSYPRQWNQLDFSTERRTLYLHPETPDRALVFCYPRNQRYRSSSGRMGVDSFGVIRIPENYVGQIDIEIVASETSMHARTSVVKTFTINSHAPRDLKGVLNKDGSVTLSWTPNASYDHTLILIKNQNKGIEYAHTVTNNKCNTYTVTDLDPGCKYRFIVYGRYEMNVGITARTDYSNAVEITVVKNFVEDFDVIDKTHNTKIDNKIIMKLGRKIRLEVTKVLPKTATLKSFYFRSSNPKIATIDQNGQITALRRGTCRISIISKDKGGASKTILLRVK